MTPEEVTSYQEGVKELQEEEKKEQPRKKRLRKLMKATFIGRRDWIVKDAPRSRHCWCTAGAVEYTYVG